MSSPIVLSFIDKKYWLIETKATVPCAVTKDGLVVMFNLQDVKFFLDNTYPHEGKLWFFNESRDREIAEQMGSRVYANPQILWRHYLPSSQTQITKYENK